MNLKPKIFFHINCWVCLPGDFYIDCSREARMAIASGIGESPRHAYEDYRNKNMKMNRISCDIESPFEKCILRYCSERNNEKQQKYDELMNKNIILMMLEYWKINLVGKFKSLFGA